MKKQAGFTLIELMIVVAIIGILAAIAYPSYIESVRKTRFSQAKEGAMEVASGLERAVSQTIAYPDDLSKIGTTYTDMLSYDYQPQANTSGVKSTYYLVVKESTTRFGIWVGINSAGTRCGCDGKVCTAATAGTFTAAQKSCTSPTVAF